MAVSGKRMLTLRDMEERVQEDIAEYHVSEGYSFVEQYNLLVAIKQARALEHIANLLRDGKIRVVSE